MRDAWTVIKDELLLRLEKELVVLAANATYPDEGHATLLSFTELKDRTRCAEFPNGLNFDSASEDSARRVLYDRRIEMARDYRLWWKSDFGVGLKFTSNALLGLKWREELELEIAHHKAGVTEQLWAIAERQLPAKLQQVAKYFRRGAQGRLKQIEGIQREHERIFRELGPGTSEETKT